MNDTLLRFHKNQKYLVLDVEAESLNLCLARPWEIGYIVCTQNKILVENCDFIFLEDLNISADAARITRFDYNLYRQKAKDAKKVFDEFSKYLYDPDVIVVGQNILNYDGYIIQNFRRALGLKPDWSFINRVIDTRALSFAIQKSVKTVDHNDLYCWQMRYMHARERGIKTSLESLLKNYSIPYDKDQHHNSLWDSQMTKEVFFKQIYEIEI